MLERQQKNNNEKIVHVSCNKCPKESLRNVSYVSRKSTKRDNISLTQYFSHTQYLYIYIISYIFVYSNDIHTWIQRSHKVVTQFSTLALFSTCCQYHQSSLEISQYVKTFICMYLLITYYLRSMFYGCQTPTTFVLFHHMCINMYDYMKLVRARIR